jgi:HTH-type transcriptional repressor of NAD biosynthesis genes
VTRSFVLLTALPPTLGHIDLVRFANSLTPGRVTVIINTQPDEPFFNERVWAVRDAVREVNGDISVRNIHRNLPQEPEDDPGFWDMWAGFLHSHGFVAGDNIVASEIYGLKLAEVVRGRFMPYDLERQIRFTKATEVRNDWVGEWDQMIPEFRKYLQKKITIFGAESTGKTTLTKRLVDNGYFGISTGLFEWARPYLETVGAELTVPRMDAINDGQYALQKATYEAAVKPFVIQDTDLFSTIGYWRNWDNWSIPDNLFGRALETKSDLYIILKSNIPFEADPIRYGGDHRELSDSYWISLAAEFKLNYVVIEESDLHERVDRVSDYIDRAFLEDQPLKYQRRGKEYLTLNVDYGNV